MTKHTRTTDKTIVIATSGFVFIGDLLPTDGRPQLELENAHNIRVWGTTRGLGQIALEGPTKDTALDPYGHVAFPIGSVVATIKCWA